MKRLMAGTTFVVVFLFSAKSHAQSGAVIPQADAGHASQAGCVILKRMGRGDRAKSRLPSLGIRGKQFRYVEGKPPEGFSLHRKMTDQDVRNLQAQGAEIIVLEPNYTADDLKEARAGCRGETGKTPNLVEAKAVPAPEGGAIAGTPGLSPMAPTPKAPTPETRASNMPASETDASESSDGATVAALLDVSSTPTEADVYIDERLSGRTPATLILMPGDHKLVIKKNGFVVWQRKFKLQSGRSSVDAELVAKAK